MLLHLLNWKTIGVGELLNPTRSRSGSSEKTWELIWVQPIQLGFLEYSGETMLHIFKINKGRTFKRTRFLKLHKFVQWRHMTWFQMTAIRNSVILDTAYTISYQTNSHNRAKLITINRKSWTVNFGKEKQKTSGWLISSIKCNFMVKNLTVFLRKAIQFW